MSTAGRVAPSPDEHRSLIMAVAAAPRDPVARRLLAASLAKAGKAQAALDQYRALLSLIPNDPDGAADAGLMALRCSMEEELVPTVHAAAQANPGHPRVWQVLGLLHRALGDSAPAAEALQRAAALAPEDARIGHGRARAALEAGRPAVALFEQAMLLAPHDESILLGLTAALIGEGRWKEAADTLQQRLHAFPNWVVGHATLARLLWEAGEREQSTQSLERALRASPRDIALWRELLTVLMYAGRHEAALEAVGRGRAAAGPHRIFDAYEAAGSAELGIVDRADALFEALQPIDDAPLAIRYVRHLLRSGRTERAASEAERWTSHSAAGAFWPLLSTAWRMLGDERWEWLEGDPRLIGIYELQASIGCLDALAETLRGLHTARGQPLDQSLRGGTQTDGNLFSRVEPEIRELRLAAAEAVRSHIAQLPPPDPRHPTLAVPRGRPVRFSGSWSVRLTSGGHHANHIHPAGWFSSACYVALPPAGERGPEPAGWLTLGEPPAELGIDLAPFRLVEPTPGRLVLFPSTMWHGTRPFEAGERLTVAFDVARPL